MKKTTFKYLIALIFLVIFSGGISVSVFPGLLKQGSWTSWQKQESENDSSRNEKNEGTELKEFIAAMDCFHLAPLHPELLDPHYNTTDFSFTRTFYLKVPTPPPDLS